MSRHRRRTGARPALPRRSARATTSRPSLTRSSGSIATKAFNITLCLFAHTCTFMCNFKFIKGEEQSYSHFGDKSRRQRDARARVSSPAMAHFQHTCNACLKPICEGDVYITRCGHVFCERPRDHDPPFFFRPPPPFDALKTDAERPTHSRCAGYDDARRMCESGLCATCGAQVHGEKDIQVRRPPRPRENTAVHRLF